MVTTVTVAYGDGDWPELMDAGLRIMRAAKANIRIESVQMGERIFNMGSQTGILPSSWDVLRRNNILLKAPTPAPEGKNGQELSKALRRELDLYAQIIIMKDSFLICPLDEYVDPRLVKFARSFASQHSCAIKTMLFLQETPADFLEELRSSGIAVPPNKADSPSDGNCILADKPFAELTANFPEYMPEAYAEIGDNFAVFEPASPELSSIISAAAMALNYIGEAEPARRMQVAWQAIADEKQDLASLTDQIIEKL